MHVRLVMNPDAGKGGHGEEQLEKEIVEAGHQVLRLRDGEGAAQDCLIVVAGGDGTVKKTVLAYRESGLPLTIIPLGMANNIARSLGINGYPDVLKKSAADKPPRERTLSLIRLEGPGGGRLLLESVGVGLLARVMRDGPPARTVPEHSMRDRRKILREQVANMAARLADFMPRQVGLRIDGRDHSGAYLLVEVMNIAYAGPGLQLAPGKDPGSGDFEVVLVGADERQALENYLAACMQEGEPENLFTRLRGRRVELRCRLRDLHLGDELCEGEGEAVFTLRCESRVRVLT